MKGATDRRKVSKDNISPSLSNSRPSNRSSSPAASSSSSSSSSDGVIESSTPPQPQSQMIPPPQQSQQQQQQQQQQYHYHHQQQQSQQPFIMPPWTPWTPNVQQQQQQQHISPSAYISNGSNNNNNNSTRRQGIIMVDDAGMIVHDDDEDISIPSIPDDVPPSPYSPPPASLFSNGEEFPTHKKSIRKQQQRPSEQPLDELRMLHPNAMYYQQQGNQNNYNNNNNISVPSDEKKMNQSQYNRQQLLPTVLYLKKDLEDSRTAMHLLQQENKALSNECDTFQNEIHVWKEQYNTAIATKEEVIVQLRQEIEQMQSESTQMKQVLDKERAVLSVTKDDVARLSNKLEASVAANQRLEVNNKELKQEIEMKSNEIKTIRTTLKEQSQTATLKLKETIASYDEKIHKLKEECQSLTIETDRLKAMHHEVQQRRTKDIASTEEMYRVEITSLRTELVEAQQTIHDLQRNKTNMEGEIQKREDMIQSLRNEITDIHTSNTTKEETMKQLHGTLADATEREEKLLSEFANQKKKLQDETDQLSRTLQNTITEKDTIQQSLTQALETSYAKYSEISANKEKLENELKELKTTQGATSSSSSSSNSKNSPISVHIIERNNELEKEIDQLKVSLSKMSSKCNDLRAEKAALQKKVSNDVTNGNSTRTPREQQQKDPKVFKFDQMDSNNEGNQNDDEMIPNRLERIRDAAERATLAKEHRRELARLKLEHEKEMKQLSIRQEQDIKDVFEEAKAEVTARSRELRRHLQNEYETKIAMLERRYQADLARMQRECDKNTAVAEEAMQAAASEVSAINEQLDKEISIRETLKGTIRELEQKLVTEQQKNKLSANLMISRKQWQRDTNNLLVSIQQECNSVFNQNLLRTGTDSPRSVTIVNNTPNTHSNNPDDNNDEGNNSSKADDDLDKSLQLNDSYLSRIADGTAALSTSMSHVAFPIHRTPWKVRKNDTIATGGGIIQKSTSYNSPLDVSQALDETEALVRSLVAK